MFLGVIVWTLYMVAGKQYVEMMYAEEYADFLGGNASNVTSLKNFIANYIFIGHVADICQIVLYLLATMSIVDLLNTNGCFDFISEWITTRNSKRLLWMVAFITYVLSANLDNLTTALMMFAIVRQLLPGSRFRMYYGAVIVIAANAGGCLTVIGDVSTLMLWVKGAVTPSSFSGAMFLPSIVAVAIPTYLISRKLPEQMDINTPRIRYRGDDTTLTRWQRILMLFVGIGGLWFIPTFHNLTKLPPFVGALCVLALFSVVKPEIIRFPKRLNRTPHICARISVKCLASVQAKLTSGVKQYVHPVFAGIRFSFLFYLFVFLFYFCRLWMPCDKNTCDNRHSYYRQYHDCYTYFLHSLPHFLSSLLLNFPYKISTQN